MNNKFKLQVNNSSKIEISQQELKTLDILHVNDNSFHLLHENRSFVVTLIESDFLNRTYTLKVSGTIYKVEIHNYLDQLIESMGLSVSSAKQINLVKAPMPGLILDINVKKGDAVKENDTLLILEAMKMENSISSPRDGIIKSINIVKGEAVDKNQLLIEFEL